jgi:hypothetical protein
LLKDPPFTKEKAEKVRKEKELKDDLEEIKVANLTERSGTRGRAKGTEPNSTSTESEKAPRKKAVQATPEHKVSREKKGDRMSGRLGLVTMLTSFILSLCRNSVDRWQTLLPISMTDSEPPPLFGALLFKHTML